MPVVKHNSISQFSARNWIGFRSELDERFSSRSRLLFRHVLQLPAHSSSFIRFICAPISNIDFAIHLASSINKRSLQTNASARVAMQMNFHFRFVAKSKENLPRLFFCCCFSCFLSFNFRFYQPSSPLTCSREREAVIRIMKTRLIARNEWWKACPQ